MGWNHQLDVVQPLNLCFRIEQWLQIYMSIWDHLPWKMVHFLGFMSYSRWWQLKYVLFSPLPWEMIQFWQAYVSNGLVNQPPTSMTHTPWCITPNPKPQTSLANEASRGDHWCMFFNRPSSNAWGLVCRCWTPGIWWPVDGQMVGRFGVCEKCIFMFVHALNVGYNIYEFMSICNMYAAMHYCWAFSIIIRHVRSVCLLPFLHHWPLIRSRHGAIKIFNLCKQLVSQ